MKDTNPIKILIAEHDPIDLELLHHELKTGGIFYISKTVQLEDEYIYELETFKPDIILSDFTFPSFDGPTAFSIKEKIAPQTPFIFISGTIGEENSIEYIRNGVTDYVLKDKLFTLTTKVKRALNEAVNKQERDKTEKELIRSEARLLEAQTMSKIGSWETNFSDLTGTWCRETFRIFGVEPANFTPSYKTFLDLIHPMDRESVNTAFLNSFNSSEVCSVDHRIITPAGIIKHVQESWRIFLDEKGQPVKAFGTCQDITERRKADEAIKKAYEEKYAVLESIEDGFFAVDKNSLVTYWNQQAEILLGQKKENILGKNLHEIFASTASKVFYDNYQKAISENSTVRFEGYSSRTGKWFAVSAFGSDNGLSVYFKDVTTQKLDENKLKESELRYRSLIEQANEAIFIIDTSLRFIDSNTSASEMMGYSKEEILQLSLKNFLITDDLLANPLKLEELKTGKTIRNERRLLRRDGKLIDVELSGKLLNDGRIVIFGQDITERKNSVNRIRQSESKFRAFFENSIDGILLTVTDGKILAANPAACEMFRMTEKEICSAGRSGIVDNSDPRVESLLLQRQMTGMAKGELTYVRKDGTRFPGELSSVLFKDSFGQERSSLFIRDITERKEAEEKLKTTSHDLQLALNDLTKIMDSSLDVICAVDAEGNFIKVSAASEAVWGYQPHELIGKPLLSFVYEGDRKKTEAKASDVMKGNLNTHFENRFIRKDGSLVPIEWTARWDEKDQVRYGVARNVTEQVLSRQKIEISENRFRQIVETAQEGIWLIDENNCTTLVNKKICDILGYSQQEMMENDIFFFMDEEGKQLFHELVEIKKAGQAGQDHFKYIAKTGKEVWTNVSANPLFDEKGQYKGSLAMITDITESRQSEERNRFKAELLNTIGQAVVAIDMDGKINFWNKAAEKIYGWTSEETVGKNIMNITPTKQSTEEAMKIMQELNAGNSWSGEFISKHKNGQPFPVYVTNAPTYDQHNKLTGIIGVSSDISERKHSEIRLKELNENLVRHSKDLAISNAELEHFAYVASHDLQEPLRMVTSFLTQLEKKYSNVIDEKGKKYIFFAVDGAKRMHQIILDLLEFSRVGRLEDKVEEINLNEVVEDIRILFRKQIEEKRAVLISEKLPVISSCNAPIRQVFQNLINNALKYSAAGRPPNIEIEVKELATWWEFSISDNGMGIAKEYFEKIFILFQRLHNKDEFSGTGIGLAITKKIIETQGGKIWLNSEEGKGSTFHFTIPK